jgi:hypothetical protein
MDENLANIHNGVIFTYLEQNYTVCRKMDGTGYHHVKLSGTFEESSNYQLGIYLLEILGMMMWKITWANLYCLDLFSENEVCINAECRFVYHKLRHKMQKNKYLRMLQIEPLEIKLTGN